ncbi:MAG: hypothetical protein IKF68_04290 [Erysipelotrichaceae bacterium]|nr:hypothetical protein [Erysipelotrichaceae bacterium]
MRSQRCLYCDKPITRYSLYHLFIEEDELCPDCRNRMKLKIRKFRTEGLECLSLYEYDSLFRTLLLQYKECYDEALKDVFLYRIDILIRLKYPGYHILYVPSSDRKRSKRGFDHLRLIFGPLGFKEVKGLKMKGELIQEGKSLNERKKMIGNYSYEGEYVRKVLIVDDISTTGSSLLAVKKAMEGHCDRIRALVLSKVF